MYTLVTLTIWDYLLTSSINLLLNTLLETLHLVQPYCIQSLRISSVGGSGLLSLVVDVKSRFCLPCNWSSLLYHNSSRIVCILVSVLHLVESEGVYFCLHYFILFLVPNILVVFLFILAILTYFQLFLQISLVVSTLCLFLVLYFLFW